jgi:hypothetical protein
MLKCYPLILALLFCGCATQPNNTVSQPRLLSSAPLSGCVVLCITTIQQSNTEGSIVSGAAGDVAVSKEKNKSSEKGVKLPQ